MDKIIYSVASYNRPDSLIKSIDSIYYQADEIFVTLNEYSDIPVELYDPKIKILISNNEKGDAYKFYPLQDSNGYYFTIDDDLIYPRNYSEYMISQIEKYKRKAIITLHGRSFSNFPIRGYYSNPTELYHFSKNLTSDKKVQFGGTGVMVFHTNLFKESIDYFRTPNMADVWIGKYAKDNLIDIICVRHKAGFILQQPIGDSIFGTSAKNDKIQTIVANESFQKKKVSVIIPTFNNIEYLDECLSSAVESCEPLGNFEILVGIDHCDKTLKYIKSKQYHPFIKFLFFNENVGPYVIKNTLASLAKSNILIFFDSDDVMKSDMVQRIVSDLATYDCVKPMYQNFKGRLDKTNPAFKKSSGLWGEGVFGIHKNLFLHYNGFEGWRCAADTDFIKRLDRNYIEIKLTSDLLFFRRLHDKGLTSDVKTNYESPLRKKYVEISNSKTDFGPLPKLSTAGFSLVYNNQNFDLVK
jgi:hypothetical protein